MDTTVLQGLVKRQRDLAAFLNSQGELSLALDSELLFKRAFIVAIGSFCEQQLCQVLEQFASRHGDPRLTCFLRSRALTKRYHDLFDWKVLNANRFWAFFGEDFKGQVEMKLRSDEQAVRWTRAFMEVGQLRNLIAHEFATASVERTVDELEELLGSAVQFLQLVNKLLIAECEAG